MPRPAIIFDFGNVIAFFDYNKATTKLAAPLGISGAELLDRLRPLGYAQLHQAFEGSQLSAPEFTAKVSGLVGLEASHAEFVAAWNDIFTVNESLIPVIAQLKAQGYRLVLGSNTNILQANHFRQHYASTLAHFDRLILSYEIGHLKPRREFYLACAEAAGALPADCVFIDDLAENIEGARLAGLAGLIYRTTPELIAELEKMGIVVDPG